VAALAAAALAVPLYQAHLGTAFGMDKQISVGSGFAALAAGYMVARLKPTAWRPGVCWAVAAVLLIYPALTGLWYARSTFHSWPNTGRLMQVLAPLAKVKRPVLETYFNTYGSASHGSAIPEYYLGGNQGHWLNFSPQSLPAIRAGRYAAVVINIPLTTLQNPVMSVYVTAPGRPSTNGTALRVLRIAPLVSALQHNRYYRLRAVIPYRTSVTVGDGLGAWAVWQRVGGQP
jgi:hypothetical protein